MQFNQKTMVRIPGYYYQDLHLTHSPSVVESICQKRQKRILFMEPWLINHAGLYNAMASTAFRTPNMVWRSRVTYIAATYAFDFIHRTHLLSLAYLLPSLTFKAYHNIDFCQGIQIFKVNYES